MDLIGIDEKQANGVSEFKPREFERPTSGTSKRGMIFGRAPWLDLAPPWDGLEIRAWLDYPKAIADLWTPPDDENSDDRAARVMLACQQTFLDHRSAVCDTCEGKAVPDDAPCKANHDKWEIPGYGVLPPPEDAEFWEQIPTPLFRAIIDRFVEEINENPTNRASRRWKRRSSRRR